MIELELNNIKKNYGLKNVLDGVNFEVKTGERISLIGENGTGKSTILKIINREEKQDEGTINIRNNSTIGYLKQFYNKEQENLIVEQYLKRSFEKYTEIETKLKELENVMANNPDNLDITLKKYGNLQEKYIALGGYELESKFKKICSGFKFDREFLNKKYNSLSGGEKTIVNLGTILLKNPNILLLDEPTNHLDTETLEWLENFLVNYRGTILLISHDRYFLDKVSTKTILLENGKTKIYFGNYSYFLKEDERRTLLEFEAYKIPIELNASERSGKEVLTIRNLTKEYDEKVIFNNLNLDVHYGEKINLKGKNGSGKSTLVKIIMGKEKDFTGEVKLGPSVKIGYIPQEIKFINENNTVLEYFLSDYTDNETKARTFLARYMFFGNNVFKHLCELSGGERVRLILAKLVLQKSNFLILDEPTNHLDISTREILEETLKKYKGTILFVSHDRYFVNKLAEREIEI